MKKLLAITAANQTEWLDKLFQHGLDSGFDVTVWDDASEKVESFCKDRHIFNIPKDIPRGLTDTWNSIYDFFVDKQYDICVISNDDVIFPKFSLNTLIDGIENYDLVGPLSNGAYGRQNIKCDIDHIQAIQDSLKLSISDFETVKVITGFCFCFGRTIENFKFSDKFLFDPKNINVGNDDDLCQRINARGGKIALNRRSFVYHFMGKSTMFDPNNRNKLWTMDLNEIIKSASQIGIEKKSGSSLDEGKLYHDMLSFPEINKIIPSHRKNTQLRVDLILEELKKSNYKKGLDMGCANGGITFALQKAGYQMTGIDYDPAVIDFCLTVEEFYKTGAIFKETDVISEIRQDFYYDFCILFSLFQWIIYKQGIDNAGKFLQTLSEKTGILFLEIGLSDQEHFIPKDADIHGPDKFVSWMLSIANFSKCKICNPVKDGWFPRYIFILEK